MAERPGRWLAAIQRLGPVLVIALFALTSLSVFASAGTTLGYDAAAYLQAAERVRAGLPLYNPTIDVAVGFGIYLYPPPFAFAVVPFTFLPAPLDLWVWLSAIVAAFLAGTALLPVRPGVRWSIVLLAAVSFPFLYAIKLGQVESLLYLAFAFGWRWIDHSVTPGLAVAAGALTKFQPALLFGWMVVTRRWRALVAGVAAVVLVAVATAMISGAASWSDYAALLGRVNKPITTPQNLTFGAVAYRAGASLDAATAIQWASVAGTVAVTLFAWLRRDAVTGFLVGVVASQLLSPILWSHYAMLLLLPVALLLERRHWWAAAIPILTWAPVPLVYPVVFAAGLLGPIWAPSARRAACWARGCRVPVSRGRVAPSSRRPRRWAATSSRPCSCVEGFAGGQWPFPGGDVVDFYAPAGDALRAGAQVYFPGFLYGPPWAVAFGAVSWLGPAAIQAIVLTLDAVALWTIAGGNLRRLGYILWCPLIPFEIAAGQLNLLIAAAIVAAQRGTTPVAPRGDVPREGMAGVALRPRDWSSSSSQPA